MASINVELLDHYGSDLTVVNAARVSFNKSHDKFDVKADAGLIAYLAQNNHWTPFAHPQATFRITCPIPIARQQFKSTVGFIYSEVSRRYVSDYPEFFTPESWRAAPTGGAKQGSGEDHEDQITHRNLYSDVTQEGRDAYIKMLMHGVAPEQARMILPQGMMTTFIVTGSLAAWARFCKQRLDSHAQAEVTMIARQICDAMHELYPFSWQELVGNYKAYIQPDSVEAIKTAIRVSGSYFHSAYLEMYERTQEDENVNSWKEALQEWAHNHHVDTKTLLIDDDFLESMGEEPRNLHKYDFSKVQRSGWVVVAVEETDSGPMLVLACDIDLFNNLSKNELDQI